MRCNSMVKGWLKSEKDKERYGAMFVTPTYKGIWMDLEERFAKESTSRVYELKRDTTLLCQEKLYVPTCFTMLKGLRDEVQSISPRLSAPVVIVIMMCINIFCKCVKVKSYMIFSWVLMISLLQSRPKS